MVGERSDSGLKQQRRPRKRRYPRPPTLVTAVLTGLVMLPSVLMGGLVSMIAFSGCLMECSEPDPRAGAHWAVLGVVSLLLPVVAALVVQFARVPEVVRWLLAIGIPVALYVILSLPVVADALYNPELG